MFLCRRLALVGRDFQNSVRGFSSIIKKDPFYSKLDCRPEALHARVDFLIRLQDLDTAAKHARLAAFSKAWLSDKELHQSFNYIDQTCDAIIGAMCEAKRYKDALELFKYFYSQSKVLASVGYFNHIIKSYVDQGLLDDALRLYGPELADTVTESLITKGLVDAGRLDEAIDRLERHPRFHSSSTDVRTTLFKALVRQGDIKKANEVLDEGDFEFFDDDPLEHDGSSMADTVTESLIDAGKLDEAMDRLKRKPWFHSFSTDVCKPLFEGLLRQGDVEKANEVLGHIWGKCHLDGKIYKYDEAAVLSCSFIEYWLEQGKEEEAKKCYDHLELSRLTKATTVNAFLDLLLRYGKTSVAWSLFNEVLYSEEEHNVDSGTLMIMVNLCFKMGRFDWAIQIFHTVKALKLEKPQVRCYRNIITKLTEQGVLFEAEHLFEEMCSDRSVEPDVSTYTTMINAYVKAGRTEDALRLSNKMVDVFLGQVAWLACL